MSGAIECANCQKRQETPDNTWPDGWRCLFGMIAVCSPACGKDFAAKHANRPFRPEDLDPPEAP